MAVRLRMKKMGSKKRPFFRIVAAESRKSRDGRFIETLGYYDPLKDPPEIKFDDDKVYKWLDRGAIPSVNTVQLLRKVGLLEKWQMLKEGAKIAELDARIEERRAKQPKSELKTVGKKLSKKRAAAEAAAEAEEQAAKEAADESGKADVEKAGKEEEKAEAEPLKDEKQDKAGEGPSKDGKPEEENPEELESDGDDEKQG